MSSALAKASSSKPKFRLARAVSDFEDDLSDEQRSTFRAQKTQTISSPPDLSHVMRLTAEVDRQLSKKYSGHRFGPRFTYFLQGVQQFAALGDVVVGGSQNMVACGVWSLVRMSILSIINTSTYVDKLSSLFMDIGRSVPRHQAMALLYPRSTKLRAYLSEYFIVVVNLCRHLFKFGQKSRLQKFATALNDAQLQAFRTELDEWAKSIKEEMLLHEAQENSGFRALTMKILESTSYQHKLATNLRVLDFCSTYNHQITWKQTRKAGNASFFMPIATYQEWRDCSDSCTLLCTGKLGSGKSVLLANIVDDLNLSAGEECCVVTYFFCRRDVQETIQARTILGSLARQMLSTIPGLAVSEICDVARFIGDVEQVLELLVQGFPSSQKAYFILDGLDECDEVEREALIQGLQKIQKTLKVLICVSFRTTPNDGWQSTTDRLVASHVLPMPDDNPDIESFIDADLERCLLQERLAIGDPALILDIQEALLRGSQGMFLWVALQIKTLCSMKTDQAIRQALADLPKDLSETFARILHDSGNLDQSLQAKTFKLVLAAQRPLTTDELREALSVTPGDAIWDPSKILNDVRSALSCCGCLLIVDEEESTVRIVHHSAKQFILDGSRGWNSMHFSAEEAQNTMADIVVTYLGYGVFGTELSRMKVQPIMVQSAPSRVIHATMGFSSTTRGLAMKLLRSRGQPAFDMRRTLEEARSSFKSKPKDEFMFSTYAKAHWQEHILYASEWDPIMLKLSTKLIQQRMSEFGVVSKDYLNRCCRALRNGNRVVLELLLETGKINPNAKDDKGRTLLEWAVVEGHKATVELLLNTGADVDEKGQDGWTPLMCASQSRHLDIAKLLLNTGADVEARDKNGWTPLMWAAQYEQHDQQDQQDQQDIIELLLNAGADLNARSVNGYTTSILATAHRHEYVLELLLNTGEVNVNAKNEDGNTALLLAAREGHKDVVELLLNTGKFDVNAKDEDGNTALLLAASWGREDVVKLLLNASADIDARDMDGDTVLLKAVKWRCKDVVKLLLDAGADVDAKDNDGHTALLKAAWGGYRGVVEFLLNAGADVDEKNNNRDTALLLAAWGGHKDVIKLLLNAGADVNAKNKNRWTALMWAEEEGHQDIAKLLQAAGSKE